MATKTIICTAINAAGSVQAAVNMDTTASVAPPLSFNDGRFTGMTESAGRLTLNNGQSATRRSHVESSGQPTITCNGNNALTFCRVNSREAVRLTSGVVTIDQCWLEAKGVGSDHADVIQAYAPGSTGTLNLRNSTIRAYTGAATAGLWAADSWSGNFNVENTVFWGGPYGWRIASDPGCHMNVSARDVFFVPPFGAGAVFFQRVGGGKIAVTQWQNVRNATIVNGVIIPGSAVPPP